MCAIGAHFQLLTSTDLLIFLSGRRAHCTGSCWYLVIPSDYPGAHPNQKYRFPSHKGIQELLDLVEIDYAIIHPVPKTYSLPKIITSDKSLKRWEILIIGLLAVGVAYVLLQELKK